ncbi:MAG: helix-turn-helix domain-containing protein [Thermoguttaceae bacterium]
MTYGIKDLCKRYAVGEHTVLGWIRNGELKAVNVGRTPTARKPRWRITEEALTAFELLRTPIPPAPKTRRRRQSAPVLEFY